MVKKILVITPRFPLPDLGACEKDRLSGIKQLRRLGFEVRVLAKVFDFQPKEEIKKFSCDLDVPVTLLSYENKFSFKRVLNPFYWDGAAYEYALAETKNALVEILDDFRPDLIWVDYTYLWPLYGILRKRKIPVITRSINFEPYHFLQEDGMSFIKFIKFLSKIASEIITIYKSNFLFAITPDEKRVHQRLGASKISVLPLRGLPICFENNREISKKTPLKVFFAGSTYSVEHNKQALELILKKIIPAVEKDTSEEFVFYLTGRKFPKEFNKYLNERIIYRGTVNNWEEFLGDMDIAMVPSLFGAGMQQKIFEPLCCGIPTIVSSRGLAGYPFQNGEHLLTAETPEGFVKCLFEMKDPELRKKLSKNSRELSAKLFSQDILDSLVLSAINQINGL